MGLVPWEQISTDRIWLAVPKPTERERIGNQIKAAMIFAGADFVKCRLANQKRILARDSRLILSRERIAC
jgi:hypothetical protein